MKIFTDKDVSRFQSKFHITPGCWIWTAFKRKMYGRFKHGQDCLNANRVAYEIYIGPIPDGMLVCHRCDNPSCVNPDHLFLGTDKDNADDMDRKGRRFVSKGIVHGMSKLTDKEVFDIKHMALSQRKIAKLFCISQATVSNIKLGKNWKHLGIKWSEPKRKS